MSQAPSLVEFDRAMKKEPQGKSPDPDNITYKFGQYGRLPTTSTSNRTTTSQTSPKLLVLLFWSNTG